MFTIKDWKIIFIHKSFEGKPVFSYIQNRYVKCEIEESGILVGIGFAYCSKKDQFNKAKGRKVALRKALERFSKEDRTLIWEEYFKHVKK